MMNNDLFGPARARNTDPGTSHDAARQVTPSTDSVREEVERWVRGRGPEGCTDDELSAAMGEPDSSTYRTRRAELTEAGRVIYTGRKRLNARGNKCMVWMHADFRHSSPAFERPLPIKEELAIHARRLRDQADWCRKYQGRVGLAEELVETAELIERAIQPQGSDKKATGPHG